MRRLYVYERARDHRRVEIFARPSVRGLVYVIREGPGQDSVTADRPDVEHYRARLRDDGFLLQHQDE